MINKVLHALTNRNGAFHDPMFVGDPDFVPADIQAPEKQLREALLLHITSTDYYVKAYLACLEAYPDIKALAEDTVTSYAMTDFPPRGVEMSGGDFLSKSNLLSYYTDRPPDSLPVNLTYRVSYHDDKHVRIEGVETGMLRLAPYTKFGVAPAEALRVRWPVDVPFSGPLRLNMFWRTSSMVEISVSPSAFPYAQVVKRLQGNPWLMHLLVNSQLVDEYTATSDVQRKVALAVIVLVLSNSAVYPG